MWEFGPYHSSIITAGNGGTKPTQGAFTIFYNQGTQRYDLEQTLQPDEQMWIDVGKLIREHVADKNGKTLPPGLTSGSYEIRDLTNTGVGTLFEGKVIYDKTYGHASYGCALCCGYYLADVFYNPIGVPLQGTGADGVNGSASCGGGWVDVSDSFYGNWSSANTSIATVDYYATHTGVSVGSTTSNTSGNLNSTKQTLQCPVHPFYPSGSVNTIKFQVQGNPYNSIFVGNDPNLSAANSIFASVSPTGGTFTTKSSDANDSFAPVPSGGPGWVVTTADQSQNNSDRVLTFSYTVTGQGTVYQLLKVTARQFAYATNNSPSDTCTLGYGTTYLYVYTPYTHPDKTSVQAGIGVTGTPVPESFNPQPPPGTVTGNGALDANSQFSDKLSYCSTSPLTLSTSITQTLSIEGYLVRQNLLTYSSSGISLTSQGPTQ